MPEVKAKINIKNRLLTRLLISHILIVTLPLFITGKVLIDTAQDSIKKTILDRNLEFANRSTRFVELKLNTATELLKTLAQFQTIFKVSHRSQELAMNTLVSEFDVFNELSVLDTLGQIVVSTSFDQHLNKKLKDNDLIESVLQSLMRNNVYRSNVYVSAERLPMMDMAEPIMLYNQVVGVLYAIVDLKAMWDLVDENKIGEKGEAFIFNSDGIYVAHSDRMNVYSKKHFSNQEVMNFIQQGKSGQITYFTDDGVEMVAAYAPMGSYGWGAMLQQPTSEAFGPARRMRQRVFQFMVVGVVLASLLAYFSSKQIVSPVNQLIAGMESFSRGDLRHRIEKVTDDEIGTLSDSFNEMAERLIEFQDKLKRSEVLETLSKLASVLSHEIRNPLNSMVINMQILKRELSRENINKGRVEKFYGILAAEIKRVDQLVSDFLMIARPPKTEKNKVVLNEILDEVVMMQVADALKKGVRIQRDFGENPIMANVDVSKMRQVFLNLTLNAIQAMPGGGRLQVELKETVQPEGNKTDIKGKIATITFSDDGHGISKKNLDKIFDFYFSTKDNGSGLGLAIVQQIIDEHHGKIKVRSKEGAGTEFIIYLPTEEQ